MDVQRKVEVCLARLHRLAVRETGDTSAWKDASGRLTLWNKDYGATFSGGDQASGLSTEALLHRSSHLIDAINAQLDMILEYLDALGKILSSSTRRS